MARVRSLHRDDARIGADALVKDAVADIDGVDPGRAALQQAVGEAAGAGAEIGRDKAGNVDTELVERLVELLSATADETGLLFQRDDVGLADVAAGAGLLLVVDEDVAGHDEGLGAGAGLGKAAFDDRVVETDGRAHGSAPARSANGVVWASQMATARASAASSGWGTERRFRMRRTISCICGLSALP